MQRQGIFKEMWQVKWSAGVATALFLYMLTNIIVTACQMNYMKSVADFFSIMLPFLMIMGPMLIGIVINWIGAIKKKRPLLMVAGISYCLNGMFGLVFLIYNIAPAILAFVGFYKLGKKPSIKPPRLT